MYIYKITCTQNNKVYIGQAINLKNRWNIHKSLLKQNKHHNSHLQNSYNKYGIDAFVYELIESVDDYNKLNERETYWINQYKSNDRNYGFNNKEVYTGKSTHDRHGIKAQKNKQVQYKGVCYRPKLKENKYVARITFDKKTKSLGHFKTAEEAAEAYQKALVYHYLEKIGVNK